jgi:hypothetical protein
LLLNLVFHAISPSNKPSPNHSLIILSSLPSTIMAAPTIKLCPVQKIDLEEPPYRTEADLPQLQAVKATPKDNDSGIHTEAQAKVSTNEYAKRLIRIISAAMVHCQIDEYKIVISGGKILVDGKMVTSTAGLTLQKNLGKMANEIWCDKAVHNKTCREADPDHRRLDDSLSRRRIQSHHTQWQDPRRRKNSHERSGIEPAEDAAEDG